jgi:hypothetical protein
VFSEEGETAAGMGPLFSQYNHYRHCPQLVMLYLMIVLLENGQGYPHSHLHLSLQFLNALDDQELATKKAYPRTGTN